MTKLNDNELYRLVRPDHPALSTVLPIYDFDASIEDTAPKYADFMKKAMRHHNGLGLSANQLGHMIRVFVMRGDPDVVCFNPKIVWSSEQTALMEEGCLTYPLLYLKIRRPVSIRARYQDEHGVTHTKQFDGISARCFQHELDHMNGIHYQTHASKLELNRAKRQLKLLQRKLKRAKNNGLTNNVRRTA